MAPEEGEPVQVDVTLDCEPGQLPEEALAEVQRLLSPEHLVPEQQPQGGDVGTGSGNKQVKRLGVLYNVQTWRCGQSPSLFPAPRHTQQSVSAAARPPPPANCKQNIEITEHYQLSADLLMFSSFMVTRSSSARCCSLSRELHTQVWPTWD